MSNANGCELASLHPGWIHKNILNEFNDDALKRIILFYVVNTPCTNLSSSAISVESRGWGKDIWKKGKLRETLMSVAGLESNKSYFVAKKTDEMKQTCKKANLGKGFQERREKESIAMYLPPKYNHFLAICYHIRNAFAHGRFSIYSADKDDAVFVLEDGVKRNTKFYVRSRMVLKRSTLVRWMDIIEAGSFEKLEDLEEEFL